MTALWIYGAGGFGREVLDLCVDRELAVAGFVDDNARAGRTVRGLPVEARPPEGQVPVVLAMADPAARARIGARLDTRRRPPPLIHSSALVAPETQLDPGTVVLAFVFVSSWVHIAESVHLNYHVSVGHDASIGPYSTVLPGARIGGNVTIGGRCLIGSNATIHQGISIGEGARVGAGAVVTSDVAAHTTVVGVPARPRTGAVAGTA